MLASACPHLRVETSKMPMRRTGRNQVRCHNSKGFSFFELLIVLGVMAILGTIVIPNMSTIVSNSRLRGGVSTLSGVFQSGRMLAVKEHRYKVTHFAVLANGPVAYIKDAAAPNTLLVTDPQAQLGAPMIRVTTLSGPGAPTALDSSTLGFTAGTGEASFNPRGLPCSYADDGSCSLGGFIYYFKDNRPAGKTGWAAVSISPAGRIKRWYWSGTTWGD